MYNARRISTILFIILFLFSCKKTTTSSETDGITFPDANFETLIREVLNKPNGNIELADLLTITELDGEYRDITDISGIEYCTNLQKLSLQSNQIIDISYLSSLTNLQELRLSGNDIIYLISITSFCKLSKERLKGNHIELP